MKTYKKDPDEKLDYLIDWSDFVPSGDYIEESTWTVGSGITKDSDTFTTTNTTIWLSGGTIDETYVITNKVTTHDGREAERSFAVLISESQGIATLAEVAIISGLSSSSISCAWLAVADTYVKLVLNRCFDGYEVGTQYEDVKNLNDFYSNYDGSKKIVLERTPVASVTSVIYLPDTDDPETLTEDTDYYVYLDKGIVELKSTFEPAQGQRKFKVTYDYGFERPPSEIVAFANLYCAFLVESNPAKNDDNVPLSEIEIGRYREKYANASTALKAKYSGLLAMEQLLIEKYKLWE